MLVDLPSDVLKRRDPIVEAIGLVLEDEMHRCRFDHVGNGMYVTHLNANIHLKPVIVNEWPFDPLFSKDIPKSNPDERMRFVWDELNRLREEGYPEPFGVCDYPEQVIEKYPILKTCDENLVILFTSIVKSEQPSYGGWRWHKWGEYIGDKKPRYEYLYDETEIDKVYVFHIYEVDV